MFEAAKTCPPFLRVDLQKRVGCGGGILRIESVWRWTRWVGHGDGAIRADTKGESLHYIAMQHLAQAKSTQITGLL